MKIIHIYDEHGRVFPGVGSTPYIVYNIAKDTATKGCDVTILERRWKGLDYKEEIEGIKFERFDLHFCSSISRKEPTRELIKSPVGLLRFVLSRTEFAFKIYKYLRRNDFDVIHVHYPFAAVILVILSRKLRRKMIYGEQIGDEEARLKLAHRRKIPLLLSKGKTPLLLRIFSPDLYLMRRVKKVVMLNERRKSRIVSAGKVKAENTTVILTGVDTSKFYPDIEIGNIKEKYGLTDKVIILFASTFIQLKGIEYLVKAANIIINELGYKNALFLLIGDLSAGKRIC